MKHGRNLPRGPEFQSTLPNEGCHAVAMKYLALLVLLTSVAAVGCKKAADDAGAPAVATASAKPVAPPLKPEEYGPKLDAIQMPLQTVLVKLLGEKVPAKWRAAADPLVKQFSDAVSALNQITPPAGAENVHKQVIKEIKDVGDVFTQVDADVKAGKTAAMNFAGPLSAKGKADDVDLDNALTAGGWDVKAFHGQPTILKKVGAADAPAGSAPTGSAPTGTTTGG